MTNDQFLDIQNRLKRWRKKRRISVEEQQTNFSVNYIKELLKYAEAKRDDNEYESVNAICNMIVTAVNSGDTLGNEDDDYISCNTMFLLTSSLIDKNVVHYLCFQLRLMNYDPYKCLLETIKELNSKTGVWDKDENKWIEDSGAYTFEEAESKAMKYFAGSGYNATVLLRQDNKHWFFVTEKMGGDATLKIITKWHKANYNKCKDNK